MRILSFLLLSGIGQPSHSQKQQLMSANQSMGLYHQQKSEYLIIGNVAKKIL